MKKILLTTISCMALLLIASCSEDTEISTQTDNTSAEFLNRGSNDWGGEIGIERDGRYYITADEAALRADLEEILSQQGITTTLEELTIVEKRLVNSPFEVAYVLLGVDLQNRSVGVQLTKQLSKFVLSELEPVATSCSGCPTGCNLSYLLIDGKKVPYCNENGCGLDCTKSETNLF